MMRIKVVHAMTGATEEFVKYEMSILKKYAHPGTDFEIGKIQQGAASIESHFDEYIGAIDTFRLVKEAEQSGFDGVIITCFANANVEPSRELASIPVIGSGMASMVAAGLLGHQFSIITTGKSAIYRLKQEAQKLGFAGKLMSLRRCKFTVLELLTNREKVIESFLEAAQFAIKDGADVVIPGCFGMVGIAEEVQHELKVPIVDPAGAAVGIMEMLVKLGIAHSKSAYPFPPEKNRSWGF
jgi:allantoin racemase